MWVGLNQLKPWIKKRLTLSPSNTEFLLPDCLQTGMSTFFLPMDLNSWQFLDLKPASLWAEIPPLSLLVLWSSGLDWNRPISFTGSPNCFFTLQPLEFALLYFHKSILYNKSTYRYLQRGNIDINRHTDTYRVIYRSIGSVSGEP